MELFICMIILAALSMYFDKKNKQQEKDNLTTEENERYTLQSVYKDKEKTTPEENSQYSPPASNVSSNGYINVSFPRKDISEDVIGLDLNCIPENYALVDLETTGFNPQKDHIIEVGCVKIRRGKEIDRFETLIKPPESISERITEITGIDDYMLRTANAPKFEDIAQQLWDFLKDEIIVGHNVKFDIRFLNMNFLKVLDLKLYNSYVDTLSLSRKIYPNFESYKLEDIAKELNIKTENHQAINDCLTVEVLINDMTSKILKGLIPVVIPVYKFEDLGAEFASKYALKLIGSIDIEEADYSDFETIINFCNELVENDLATAKLCKKMGSICEKIEEYDEAISFYNAAMDIDPELDFYKKIERLEKKLYEL